MGVMEKMRNSTASILWILIFSFGFLWVMADTQVFDAIGAGPQSMGEVNGVPITFDDYNERVAYYTEQFNRQSTDALTSEIRAGFEQRAWDDLVAAELMRQKMDALGITVTDEEVGEMILGDDPVQFIRDQFADEEGNIDRVALRAAIEAPENQEIWVVVEDQLRQTRRQEKLNNFIMAGMKPTQLEIEQEFVNENTFADVRFIRFPFIEIPDSLLNNSEEELRAYHRENSNRFQREETYQFRYVSWDIRPTETDTLNTIRDIERLADGFARAEDVAEFLELNQSDVPFTDEFVPEDEIQENFRFVADLAVGEVSDLRMINGNPHLLKKVDENRDGIKYAVMTYRVVPDPVGTVDALAEQAREFEFYASEDDFQDEADRRELVVQVGSATKGSQFVPGIGVSQQL
ncbi:MAG: peptidylprolyl isomerase, partial [Balneolaceae bacterium]